ncbi:probable proteasome inhibitor isoform X3 [Phoenix dactylifera]|uniref:Probable proteasome inhibitor isoform X3 n=1 Tax=Phoenix dactylifera TaxID=42345 RepID=A0A8B7C1M4_PHODC|nr:probable proteasome inhibitor isoform X3 [Phoenix dactylifera]
MATATVVTMVIRNSRPSFRNPHDKIAFAVHASFLSAGFFLTATGKNALSYSPPIGRKEVGIEGWNELEGSYGFLYSKTEKGQKKNVLVRCLVIGDFLAIYGLKLEGEQKEPFNLQVKVNDYLSDDGNQVNHYGELYKDMKGLVKNLNFGILAKLEPKVGSSIVYPPVPPFVCNDAFSGPGSGFYPERSSSVGGDMLVGPNDPRWFGSGEFSGSFGGLPGVPPGAHFDPYGPPGVPGFVPGHFARQPQQPGSPKKAHCPPQIKLEWSCE